jgi:chromosome segregation ATPase
VCSLFLRPIEAKQICHNCASFSDDTAFSVILAFSPMSAAADRGAEGGASEADAEEALRRAQAAPIFPGSQELFDAINGFAGSASSYTEQIGHFPEAAKAYTEAFSKASDAYAAYRDEYEKWQNWHNHLNGLRDEVSKARHLFSQLESEFQAADRALETQRSECEQAQQEFERLKSG